MSAEFRALALDAGDDFSPLAAALSIGFPKIHSSKFSQRAHVCGEHTDSGNRVAKVKEETTGRRAGLSSQNLPRPTGGA